MKAIKAISGAIGHAFDAAPLELILAALAFAVIAAQYLTAVLP